MLKTIEKKGKSNSNLGQANEEKSNTELQNRDQIPLTSNFLTFL